MKIGENILFWTGMHSGSGVVFRNDDIVTVDAQDRGDQAALMLELMRLYKLDPRKVKHIICTHGDNDHIGGITELKRATGAPVVAHKADSGKIENAAPRSEGAKHRTARSGPFIPCRVDLKVEKDMTLQVGDLTLQLIHTPGHTPGSMCIYHKDTRSLFTGDVVVGEGPPYKIPFVRMGTQIMLQSLNKLNQLDVEWLLPGHGDIIHGGNKHITDLSEALKTFPDKVLAILKQRPATPAQVSDEFLAWPSTVDTVFAELESQGKIRKTTREASTQLTTWTAV